MKDKVRFILIIAVCVPFITIAQGIKFEEGMNWEQIQAKAQRENKMIFVDCYATWCGPCKQMEKSVFTNSSVGKFVGDKFIALRLQMDSTSKDEANVKLLYSLARSFAKKYKVNSLPTFLFFSSDGYLLHKGTGYKEIQDFNTLTSDAIDPEKQYNSVVNNWRSGKVEVAALPALAKKALYEYNDKILSDQIARDYISRYLDLLEGNRFYTGENLSFINSFTKAVSSTDNVFNLILNNQRTVDSIMKWKGYAMQTIKAVVTAEQIYPIISNADLIGKTPNWKDAEKAVKQKYNNEIAYLSVLDAKVNWYEKIKNSPSMPYTSQNNWRRLVSTERRQQPLMQLHIIYSNIPVIRNWIKKHLRGLS
jgi:thioredoxin-related protein